MAELRWVIGGDAERPEVPELALLVDAGGPPGDRAVVRLGDVGHEGDDVLYVIAVDAWTERSLSDGVVTVDVHAWDETLARLEVNAGDLPVSIKGARLLASASLRAEPQQLAAINDEATLVIPYDDEAPPDEAIRQVLAHEEWPLIISNGRPQPEEDGPDLT